MAEGKRIEHCPIPSDFQNRMNVQLGKEEWVLLEQALESNPKASVQINPLKKTEKFDACDLVPWYTNGRILTERPLFTWDPLYHAGAYYSQESSSMFLAYALEQLKWRDSSSLRALDLCAAPGGKSLLMAHYLHNKGVLISNEINKQRNAVLIENLTKSGCTNYVVANAGAEAWGKMEQYFDLIVVDAPCSGEGMFRKDYQARKEWSLSNVEKCADRQRSILSDVVSALRPGGYLIYSTCTFAREENEDVVKYLCDEHHLESIDLATPSHWPVEAADADGMYGYRFWPHRVPGEGFFMAVLQAPQHSQMMHRAKPKNYFFAADKKQLPVLKGLVELDHALVDGRGVLFHCPLAMDEINQWAHHVYFTAPGLALGEIKQTDFIPDSALALSTGWNIHAERVDLDLENALRYLRGENPEVGMGKGLALVCFDGKALGWVKRVGARCNNYYPKEWRIRMR